MPTLSVTVPNYNYAKYLPQCLESILGQTMRDFELILINDASTDDSLEVIGRYASDPRIRLIDHERNAGLVPSLIEGARESRGRYLTVISADDYCLSPDAFATLLAPMEADPQVVFAYPAYGQYRNDGVRQYLRRPRGESYVRSGRDEFMELLLDPYILHSGTIIRRSAYEAVGGWDARTRYNVDMAMWLPLCSQGKVAYCADELYAYRMHPANMSHSRGALRASLRETFAAIDAGFARFAGDPAMSPALRRHAIRCALVAIPTDDIFSGRLRRGWYGYWCSFRTHPLHTVLQRQTAVLIARTLLGRRGYEAVRAIMRRWLPRPRGSPRVIGASPR